MAVSKAEKQTELAQLEQAFRQADTAVLVDYRGITVPQVTELRRQIKECALFIAIISKNTDARLEGYFRREWKLAIDRTHDMAEERAFLLPVVIDETPDGTSHVPEKFHEVQWTRLPLRQAQGPKGC